MSDKHTNPDSKLSDGLYRFDHPDSDIFLPRPVWSTRVATLGDYIQQLREIDNQRNQPSIASQSSVSCKYCYDIGYDSSGQRCQCADNPNFQHVCPHNPLRTCNCGDKCADEDRNNEPNEDRCPDYDGFSDNLEYTGIPFPKPKSSNTGWPCVVVGAVCETGIAPAEFVSNISFNSANADRDGDAGQCDGPYVSTNH